MAVGALGLGGGGGPNNHGQTPNPSRNRIKSHTSHKKKNGNHHQNNNRDDNKSNVRDSRTPRRQRLLAQALQLLLRLALSTFRLHRLGR